MKNYLQKTKLFLSLEKDDERNPTGMQLRGWKLNNGTTILLRVFKDNPDSDKVLWDGKRTNGGVHDLLLKWLRDYGLILSQNNWSYSTNETNDLIAQDEYEEKERCHYFSWSVIGSRLQF